MYRLSRSRSERQILYQDWQGATQVMVLFDQII